MKVSSLLKAVLVAGAFLLGAATQAQMPPRGAGCYVNGDPHHLGNGCGDDAVRGPKFVGNSPVQAPGCPAGKVASGGVCVDLIGSVKNGLQNDPICSTGYVLSGGSCVLIPNQVSNIGQLACPPGYIWVLTSTTYAGGGSAGSNQHLGTASCVMPDNQQY